MLTGLYIIMNVLNHCNIIAAQITLKMCLFRSQRTYVLTYPISSYNDQLN